MSETQPLRADAKRNREKILATAGAVFAEKGVQASLDEIARRAGIGPGTLYRHFPSREALIREVFLDRRIETLVLLETAQQCEDPWTGLAGWVRDVSRMLATDRAFADVVVMGEYSRDLGLLRKRTYDAMSTLVERTVSAGAIRPDFTVEDLVLLLLAVAGIAHRATVDAPAAVERFVALALDGYHDGGTRPAPPAVRVFPWVAPEHDQPRT
jgi:AcrR family transcriptional regulator